MHHWPRPQRHIDYLVCMLFGSGGSVRTAAGEVTEPLWREIMLGATCKTSSRLCGGQTKINRCAFVGIGICVRRAESGRGGDCGTGWTERQLMKDAGDKEIFGRRRIAGARNGQQKLDGLCWVHENWHELWPRLVHNSAKCTEKVGTGSQPRVTYQQLFTKASQLGI